MGWIVLVVVVVAAGLAAVFLPDPLGDPPYRRCSCCGKRF